MMIEKKAKRFLSIFMALLAPIFCFSCTAKPDADPYAAYAEVPVEYKRLTAEYEDKSLYLWFDHSFKKITRDMTEKGVRDTYKLYMGRNETEDCQFFLSSAVNSAFSLSLTGFKNESAEAGQTKLYYEYYFNMPFGESGLEKDVPDAILEVTDGQKFSLSAGTSAGFVLQARTGKDTKPGLYTATLDVLSLDGKQIKTAKVFLNVWDFEISDKTECRTAMWIEKNALIGGNYKEYYDYLLENRVSAYELPYDLSDPRVDEYLDNPRVTSFNILGFKFNKESGKTETQIKNAAAAAYAKLSPNENWNKKGYFYLVDEPLAQDGIPEKLEWIKEYGGLLEEAYPGYRQMSPFYTNNWIETEFVDWIEYLSPYINIWVPKTYAYTSVEQASAISGGKTLYDWSTGEWSRFLENKYGTYAARMKEFAAEGHEPWWYITSQPTDPYITFNTTEQGIAYRTLFWQQKQNGVKGLLYWSTNYWSGDGWNNREAEWSKGSRTYGNGVLVYPGKSSVRGPVGSLRLEAIRDGIEDYQMLSMLTEAEGTQTAETLIARLTANPAVWQRDDDVFAGLRVLVGNYLEQALNK